MRLMVCGLRLYIPEVLLPTRALASCDSQITRIAIKTTTTDASATLPPYLIQRSRWVSGAEFFSSFSLITSLPTSRFQQLDAQEEKHRRQRDEEHQVSQIDHAAGKVAVAAEDQLIRHIS